MSTDPHLIPILPEGDGFEVVLREHPLDARASLRPGLWIAAHVGGQKNTQDQRLAGHRSVDRQTRAVRTAMLAAAQHLQQRRSRRTGLGIHHSRDATHGESPEKICVVVANFTLNGTRSVRSFQCGWAAAFLGGLAAKTPPGKSMLDAFRLARDRVFFGRRAPFWFMACRMTGPAQRHG